MRYPFHAHKNQASTNYLLNGTKIQEFDDIKDLGVIKHVDKITLHAYKFLGFLTRCCKDFKNPYSLLSLFSSLMLPILEYGSIIWFTVCFTDTLVKRIQKIQDKFCKLLAFFYGASINAYSNEEVCRYFLNLKISLNAVKWPI